VYKHDSLAVSDILTINSILFGSAIDTAAPCEMPNLASFSWNEDIWAFNCVNVRVMGLSPGMITAIEFDCFGNEFERVVMVSYYARPKRKL
jgi:hypothetical protein